MGSDTPKASINLAQQENNKARARYAQETADRLASQGQPILLPPDATPPPTSSQTPGRMPSRAS